jgi:hypothetical protein
MPVVLFRSSSWDSRQGLHEQLNARLREVWMHTPRNPLSYGWSGCSRLLGTGPGRSFGSTSQA